MMLAAWTRFNSRTSCEVRHSSSRPDTCHNRFNSRTSCEVRRQAGRIGRYCNPRFNSRTSCEVRLEAQAKEIEHLVSTHAPLARCDASTLIWTARTTTFQLTHLLRGATKKGLAICAEDMFQLTHLLRGATDLCFTGVRAYEFQLTHLLRGATFSFTPPVPRTSFNSRTSCEVRLRVMRSSHILMFQLTHLLRGATRPRISVSRAHSFNSRTSCEVRQSYSRTLFPPFLVSTHAPLARCDWLVTMVTLYSN